MAYESKKSTQQNKQDGLPKTQPEIEIEKKAEIPQIPNVNVTLTEVKPEEKQEQKMVVESQLQVQQPIPAPIHSEPYRQSDTVTLIFKDVVSDRCVIEFGQNGKYGTITAYGDMIDVPYREFFGEFLADQKVKRMLLNRELVIEDGLSEKDYKKAKCIYTPGEFLTVDDPNELLDYSIKELKNVFEKLAPNQKEIVGTIFATAYNESDKRVTREKLIELNNLSGNDLFKPLLKAMSPDYL